MRVSGTIGSARGLAAAWWLPRAVLILGLAGAVSLVLTEFSTIAAITLALALLRDLPEANEVGVVGIAYEGAAGTAGPGLYLEIGGGLLLAGAGALAVARRRA